MKTTTIKDQSFEKLDGSDPLPKGDYEHCIFNNCDFSNADLSEIFFLACTFSRCNLSMANLAKTTLRDIKFNGCKMLGMHFNSCNQFGFSIEIEDCIMNHSSFYQTKLRKTLFRNTTLLEADFTECDLAEAIFDNCELAGATFDNTNLEKADFRTSFQYSIDPQINKIKKARFSLPEVTGLLDKYDIEIDGIR